MKSSSEGSAARAEGRRGLSAIPFNRPFVTGRELGYIEEAIRSLHLSGDGEFTRRCERWLEASTGSTRAFLTPSCTAALEMAALLLGLGPGDEVILPSFTFVSTANAFLLRGAELCFVDVRPDTLNLDECAVEEALSSRTRVIAPVHYAGVGCAMDELCDIARRAGAHLVEDAAQGILATYRGRPLGAFGALAALSFHETKNAHAGEGGALLINDPALLARAGILRDKGTDRSAFLEGLVDRYTWQGVGSSFLPSEITAAFLWAQLEQASAIREARMTLWRRYYESFAALERNGLVRRPVVPAECEQNAHMFYLVLRSDINRAHVLEQLARRGINAVFHYVPLHESPFGRRFRRPARGLPVTEAIAPQLVRLPLWVGMEVSILDEVAGSVEEIVRAAARSGAVDRHPPSRTPQDPVEGRRRDAECGVWRRAGHLFVPDGDLPWARSHASLPFVSELGDSRFEVAFSSRDEEQRSSIGTLEMELGGRSGRVISVADRPVLGPGEHGAFDDCGVSMGCLVRRGEERRLYYLGWSRTSTVPFRNFVGLAISAGGSMFERVSRAPVLERSAADPYSLSYPWVLEHRGAWWMWYGSMLSWSGDARDPVGEHVIKVAWSDDGMSWRTCPDVCLGPRDVAGSIALARPCVLIEPSGFRMWFSHRGRGPGPYRVGYAESDDGVRWRVRAESILEPAGTGWDSSEVAYAHVFRNCGRLWATYCGDGYGRTGFGLALHDEGTSEDTETPLADGARERRIAGLGRSP